MIKYKAPKKALAKSIIAGQKLDSIPEDSAAFFTTLDAYGSRMIQMHPMIASKRPVHSFLLGTTPRNSEIKTM